MEIKRYVQHISGQGEKWEVAQDLPDTNEYQVHTKSGTRVPYHFLPRYEYRPCEPQEEWEDVTGACEVNSYSNTVGEFYSILHFGGLHLIGADGEPRGRGGDCNVMCKKYGYRVRKIDHLHNGPAFIIERKKHV